MFKYSALNESGEYIEGEMTLLSESLVEEALLKQRYTPITITPLSVKKTRPALFSRKAVFDRQQFFENIHDYMDSGVPVDKALELESDSSSDSQHQTLFSEMVLAVREGQALSTVMAEHEEFLPLHVGIVRVGEETDSLQESVALLAELSRDMAAIKQKIRDALIYPAVLVGVMMLSLLILFGVVIPKFKLLFEGMGVELDGITRLVIGTSNFFVEQHITLLLLLALLLVVITSLKRNVKLQRRWSLLQLRLPLVGLLVRHYHQYMIAMILQILMAKKMTVVEAFSYVRDSLSSVVYKREMALMMDKISRGESVSATLNPQLFSSHYIYIVSVGEKTGRLDQSFAKLASYYYKQLDNKIRALVAYAEPTIIMVLGVLVGVIIVSMLKAILSINELAM